MDDPLLVGVLHRPGQQLDQLRGSIRRYVVVHECGTQINPMIVDGQIHGGCAQGIGQLFGEGARYDEHGQLLSGSLMDYPIPRAEDMPSEFDIQHIETPSPLTVGGIKGMGEGGTVSPGSVLACGIADALRPFGVRLTELARTEGAARETHVVLAVFGFARDTPRTARSRARYCGYARSVLELVPNARAVVI